ncbi:MAG TPA: ComEC/Rec2 family competence protein [Rhodopila sp.]|nr:ComEC/Rec2 family competence protein [Rhodopila sp.]
MRLVAAVASALASWFAEERDHAPLWLPVSMGAGVLLYFTLRFEPPVWLGAALAVPAMGLAIRLPAAGAPLTACALGFAAAQMATIRAPPMEWYLPRHAIVVSGTVVSVEVLPAGRRITIQPARLGDAATPLTRSVRIRLRRLDNADLVAGDDVRIRALIRPPAPPAYPGAWDLQRDAFYAGLGASGYALGDVERLPTRRPAASLALVQDQLLQRLRETVAQRVTAVIPGAAGAIAVTLLTGAARSIPAADHAAFRNSGLAHLLAVAGLHIGIVMGYTLLLARVVLGLNEHASLHWPTRKLAALCALATGAGYLLLTGMHVPTIRSFVMASLFTVALLLDRRPFSLRGLGVAAVVLMLTSPQELPEVSFQMSFSAVLALIAGYEALRPWLSRLHGRSWARRAGSHIAALALTSALAGTASAPYGAYHFGQVQLYFVLANMVAVPLTALWVMPAGLIALALMPLHLESVALVPMGWGAQAVLWVARNCAAWPSATLRVPHLPAWGLALFSIGLAWLGIWRTRWRLLGLVAMMAGLSSTLLDRPPDLLVSSDARLIAVRSGGEVYLQQMQGGSKFVRDAWAAFWAVPDLQPLSAGASAESGIMCQQDICLLKPYRDRPGALLVRKPERLAGCREASVMVSAEPARGLCPRPWPRLVDRFTVWRGGAAAIWLDRNGARVLTDRMARGRRPWVPPPPPRRGAVDGGLTPAQLDPGADHATLKGANQGGQLRR